MSQNNPNIHTPNRGRQPASQPAGGHVHHGSAGLPVNYNKRSVIKKAMADAQARNECISCFGGQLFFDKDGYEAPVIRHVISCTDQELLKLLSCWYRAADRMRPVSFFPYLGSDNLGDGTVAYTFAVGRKVISMRQLMNRPDCKKHGSELFSKLVDFLCTYRDELTKQEMKSGGYVPLLSISLDTVFMDADKNLYLLPLRSLNHQYPMGFPLEANTPEADERTDLYTAALLAVQVISGCEYESSREGRYMKLDELPETAKQSLCLFPSGRHSLNTVRNFLKQDETEEENEKKPGGKEKPKDPAGNPIRPPRSATVEEDPEVADEEVETVRKSGVRGIVNRLLGWRNLAGSRLGGTSGYPDDNEPSEDATAMESEDVVDDAAAQVQDVDVSADVDDIEDDYDVYDDADAEEGYDDEYDDEEPEESGEEPRFRNYELRPDNIDDFIFNGDA